MSQPESLLAHLPPAASRVLDPVTAKLNLKSGYAPVRARRRGRCGLVEPSVPNPCGCISSNHTL